MKVKIIEVNQRYNEKYIGKIFEVIEVEEKYYKLLINGVHKYFEKNNCEVVEDVEKSCKTCNYVKPCGKKYLCEIEGDFARWIPIPPQEVNGGIVGVGQDAPTIKTGTTEEAKHYQVAEVQPITIMQQYMTKEMFQGFLYGNLLKYALRYRFKGKEDEDLGKCYQYLKWLQQSRNGEEIIPGK